MDFLSLIYQNLSNREKAIILWIILILIYTQYTDRYFYKTILGILKIVFWSKISIYICILGIISILVFGKLIDFKIIDYSFIKDFIYWFFGVALYMFFSLSKASNNFFLDEIKKLIKLEIFIQILINLVSFNVMLEFMIIPVIFVFSVGPIFIKNQDSIEKQQQVIVLYNVIISIIVISLLMNNVKHIFENYKLLFNLHTLQSIYVPILLTVCVIPYLYTVALIINYETIFKILKMWSKDFTLKDRVEIIKFNNINLKKIYNFWENFDKVQYWNSKSMKEYILRIKK